MANADTFVEKDSSKYLLTWNSFGNKFAALKNHLDKGSGIESKINIVCCQEFGSPGELASPDAVKADHSYKFIPFANRGPDMGMHVFWHSWSRTHNPYHVPDNLRCTVAIIRCGPRSVMPVCDVLLDEAQRPVIGVDYGGAWIYSFHNNAHGGAPAAARSMINWVARVNKGLSWIIAGDFNCKPGSFTGDFVTRYDKTQSTTRRSRATGADIPDNLYDYVVQSRRGHGDQDPGDRRLSLHIGQRQPAHILSSDHFPVLFQIYSTKGMA